MNALSVFWKKLTQDAGLKILSLFLAFLLWLVVVSIDNPMMTLPFSSIPVTVENADVMAEDGKAFELTDSSRNVSISVRAERSVLSELARDNFRATVDMTELDGNRVPIEVKATKYADRIQSITPRQAYATVVVEDLMESQFAVRVETVGTLERGYTVGSTTLGNNLVRVSGPESVVSTVDHAAVQVDVTGMVSDIHTTEKIRLLDSDGNVVDTSSLTLSITESYVSVSMWKVKEVPVYCTPEGTPAPGFAYTGVVNISPEALKVTGTDKTLSKISEITIPAAAVSMEGASGTVEVTVDISQYLPDGIYLLEGKSEVTVTAEVEMLETRIISVPIANLTVTNVPDGMRSNAENLPAQISVTVQGLREILDQVNPAEIRGTASLAAVQPDANGNITPDLYDAAVALDLPEGVIQGPASIQLLLQVNTETSEQEQTAESPAEGGEEETETGEAPEEAAGEAAGTEEP